MSPNRKAIKLPTLLAMLVTTSLLQADVMSWRNAGNGEYPESSPPVNWNENVLWQTSLDDFSNACPILVGDKLFFCQEPSTLICADRSTGEILWKRVHDRIDLLGFNEEEKVKAQEMFQKDLGLRREINRLRNDLRRLNRRLENDAENETLKESVGQKESEIAALREQRQTIANDPKFGAAALVPTHGTNGYTSFTPVSDGEQIYVAFGQGIVAAYDLQGNQAWAKLMEKPDRAMGRYGWGGSTSPVLVGDKLIVRFDDYTALNAQTGEEVWRIPSEVTYGTPTVFEIEGVAFLFTPRGNVIRAEDGETIQSELVALHPKYSWTTVNTPAIEDGVIYSVRGVDFDETDGYAQAFRIPHNLDTLYSTGIEEIWKTNVHEGRYYASPIAHQGLMYVYNENSVLTVLEMATGEKTYERKVEGLKGIPYSSISLAGDKLFFSSDEGIMIALQPGREYKELGRSRFDTFRSTPIFADDIAYLRTYESLYAIKGDR